MYSLPSDNIKEATRLFKERIYFYENKIAEMELVFSKLQLVDNGRPCQEYYEIIEKIKKLQELFDVKEVTSNTLALAHADRVRKHNNYTANLKICLKMYVELNDHLTKKIEYLKRSYEQAEIQVEQIVTMTENDLKVIQKKINRYENELINLQNKYPWLKNNEYNLPNISKEISLLTAAKAEKEELVNELSKFGGLKPDFKEAKDQVSQIKVEYEEMSKKLSNAM